MNLGRYDVYVHMYCSNCWLYISHRLLRLVEKGNVVTSYRGGCERCATKAKTPS